MVLADPITTTRKRHLARVCQVPSFKQPVITQKETQKLGVMETNPVLLIILQQKECYFRQIALVYEQGKNIESSPYLPAIREKVGNLSSY